METWRSGDGMPTVGFNVETLEHTNLCLTVCDGKGGGAAHEGNCVDSEPEDQPLGLDSIKWLKEHLESFTTTREQTVEFRS